MTFTFWGQPETGYGLAAVLLLLALCAVMAPVGAWMTTLGGGSLPGIREFGWVLSAISLMEGALQVAAFRDRRRVESIGGLG